MKAGIAYRSKRIDERGLLYANKLLETVRIAQLQGRQPVWGDGTLDNPFKPKLAMEWQWLAAQDSQVEPMFIEVGGRLIARWGTAGGKFKDYATDVTDFVAEVRKDIVGKGKQDTAIGAIADTFRQADDKIEGLFGHKGLSAYSRKSLRIGNMTDTYAAAKSRQLMQGIGDAHLCPELANSLVALLVCEPNRSPSTFAISLMLLDLVETSTTYGLGGAKTYTWKSMLMHHVKNQTFPIPGRGVGSTKPLGKHPMAGEGTAKFGKNLVYTDKYSNVVVDRIVSIASVWFTHFLARRITDWDFFIIKAGSLGKGAPNQPKKGWKDANEGWLQRLCMTGLGTRLATLDLLIGGTTVYYEDIDGNPA